MVLQEAHRDARRQGPEHAVAGPAVADFDAARGRIAEPGEEPAQTAPEDHDRPRALPALRFERRVESAAVVILEQSIAHGDGDLTRNLPLGFEGRGAQVGREHEVGAPRSGLSAGSGSVSYTSSPAAPNCPVASPSARAASSMSPPRAAFTRITPGRIAAISLRLMSPRFSSESGTCRVIA